MDIERAKQKIAKLMALADPQRGAAANEAETALRQAQALMKKFNLEQADILDAGGKLKFVWEQGFYPFATEGKFNKKCPTWFQWIATGVATFTDTIVSLKTDPDVGAGVIFKGEENDVSFALWLISYLKDCVRRGTRDANVGSSQNRETFRKAMGSTLSRRMIQLSKERRQSTTTSDSRALVVVDTKLAERDAQFGQARYKTSKVRIKMDEAGMAGVEAGNRVNFNRPVTGTTGNSRRLTH